MASLKVEQRSLAALVPYAHNPRTHSEAQIAEIAASIRRFGFVNPVLVGPDNGVIAGHGRLLAAKSLGLADVPVIVIKGLTDAQRRALGMADNRIALNSGWDLELLRSEIGSLQGSGEDLLDIGFTTDEIDSLFEESRISVREVMPTGTVDDRFWIAIRGPLAAQAEALKQLQAVMANLPDVEVELGTIAVDP